MKKKIYTASWTLTENPLYIMTCPHCKATIIMSHQSLISKLIIWAKMLKKIIKLKP